MFVFHIPIASCHRLGFVYIFNWQLVSNSKWLPLADMGRRRVDRRDLLVTYMYAQTFLFFPSNSCLFGDKTERGFQDFILMGLWGLSLRTLSTV